MGKHSKNNNDRAFFSHAERKAAAYGRHSSGMLGGHNTAGGNFVDSGWGSEARTLDSDSMKDIDACSLSLQPCVEPLVSPSGVVYDKQVLLEYILARKKEIGRETAAWEAQQKGDETSAAAAAAAAHEARVNEFVAQQEGLSQADLRARAVAGGAAHIEESGVTGRDKVVAGTSDRGVHAADTNFWVTTNTPDAAVRLGKPDGVVRCPVTNEPLRLKAMTPIIFTPAEAGASSAELVAMKARERYICPLTKKAISNVNPATVLKPSGMVVSSQCIKDFVRKDMLDPFTDPPAKLKEKDIIKLRVEGTGYAARTDESLLKVTTQKEAVGRF